MHIEFLLEEPSAEAALRVLLPRLLENVTFVTHAHNGKHDLLAKLPNRLKGYRRWMQKDMRIVVLVDNDQDDCRALKARLESAAHAAGFYTKSSASKRGRFEVLNRLAIEELEAWYFGDPDALVAAYPGLSAMLTSQAKYRNPDAISGGTWEALERLLQRAGYYPGGMPKVETARNVSQHMDPGRNRSRSFQVFRDGLLALARAAP